MSTYENLRVGGWFYECGRGERVHIIGETSRSWLIGNSWRPIRINKKELLLGNLWGYRATSTEAENIAFMRKNVYRIARQVERCDDPNIMRQIANLICYMEEKS